MRGASRDYPAYCFAGQLNTLSSGGGPSLVLEMLANINLATDLDFVAIYGCIFFIGSRGEVTINVQLAMMKEIDVCGYSLFNGSQNAMDKISSDLITGLSDGSLKPVICREMPLVQAAAAHRALLGPGAYGKIVWVPV